MLNLFESIKSERTMNWKIHRTKSLYVLSSRAYFLIWHPLRLEWLKIVHHVCLKNSFQQSTNKLSSLNGAVQVPQRGSSSSAPKRIPALSAWFFTPWVQNPREKLRSCRTKIVWYSQLWGAIPALFTPCVQGCMEKLRTCLFKKCSESVHSKRNKIAVLLGGITF